MSRFLVITTALAIGGLAAAGAPSAFEHDDLDAILRATVRGEGVDYAAVRADHRAALDGYLDLIADFDPTGLPRDERLALLINLYNATMIRAVVERDRPGYSPSNDDFKVFEEPLVRLGGRRLSLNELEHEIIRPEFGDPRIHAALVCAARSCPPLLSRAYRAEDLEEVLEDNMRRFVRDPSRNRVDRETRTLRLSQIFEWYAEDFGGRDRLDEYVDRYHPAEVKGFDVAFIPYSWELNRAPAGR